MNKPYREYGRSLVIGALVGVGIAVIFSAGFFLRDLMQIPTLAHSGREFALLNEVEGLVERNYLRPLPDPVQREYNAIRGMLSVLGDPNTYFIDPPVAQSESDALAGTYGGIGVTIQRTADGARYTLFPYDDSPALRAGIQDGDVLLRINGNEINTSQQQDAVDQLMRGEVKPENGVEITVLRDGSEEITQFIEFGVINVPSVFWRILEENTDIGYLQILRFTNRTPTELQQGLTQLRDANVRAIVLDLRNNGGGLLQESLVVADEFLEAGVAVYERTRSGEEPYETQDGGLMTDLPIAVLVNRSTASASELVAGAIRDRGRGVLIGQTTYGKGTIQQIFTLSDSSSVHITSAEWLTPNRTLIDGNGLMPDIEIQPDDSGRDIELGAALNHLLGTLQVAS